MNYETAKMAAKMVAEIDRLNDIKGQVLLREATITLTYKTNGLCNDITLSGLAIGTDGEDIRNMVADGFQRKINALTNKLNNLS